MTSCCIKFAIISNGFTSPFGKKEKKNCHLYNTILSLYISYQDITRRVCQEVKYTMDMKNYLRTKITLYEEDKNYPIWRRQERRSKYAVQLASWQLRSNSPKMSVNRSVNHIFRFLHICWQVTGKEWHRVRNADVSRWLTLGQHWCRWVLLSFHAFVRPSNHPWAWVCVLHTKRLEEMAYNLACWCIQMAYTQHSWMLMDIVGLSVRPSVRLFVYGIFRWLCICWQITWNKWHKI